MKKRLEANSVGEKNTENAAKRYKNIEESTGVAEWGQEVFGEVYFDEFCQDMRMTQIAKQKASKHRNARNIKKSLLNVSLPCNKQTN